MKILIVFILASNLILPFTKTQIICLQDAKQMVQKLTLYSKFVSKPRTYYYELNLRNKSAKKILVEMEFSKPGSEIVSREFELQPNAPKTTVFSETCDSQLRTYTIFNIKSAHYINE